MTKPVTTLGKSQYLARNSPTGRAHRGPARAQSVIARVLRGFDDYDKDVAAYRAARQALLEAVDALPQ